MLCQHCNQRPASVHVTQIINNEKKEIHLCEQCARELNQNAVNLQSANQPYNFISPFSINDFLAGFFGKNYTYQVQPQETSVMPVCNVCGMTYEQFARSGILGCANCYQVFQSTLEPALKKIHGNVYHNGKLPQKAGSQIKVKKEIEKLKEQLNKAIQAEEYEKAAQLRDRIRDVEADTKGEQ